MAEADYLLARFEENRSHLHAVAYRMTGSLNEADDAVQEAWLRLSRTDVDGVENLSGWLTTVVARVCLDILRSRTSRREESLDDHAPTLVADANSGLDAEQELMLADSVGIALLVVLEKLAPAERLAFVLHDMFDLPFDEIAPIVGRSPTAARQLASRARRRVQGTPADPDADLATQRRVVDAFLAASRNGDFNALVAVLDPGVVHVSDIVGALDGARRVIRGAATVASQALLARHRAHLADAALINGRMGIVVAPRGRVLIALAFAFRDDRIAEIDVITDPARLKALDLGTGKILL